MKQLSASLLWVFLSLCFSANCLAAKPEVEAQKATKSNSVGWTVYVDVNFGMRKRSAANDINEMHIAMGKAGYEPVDVEAHEENGDLLGYLVTYRKR